MKRGYSRIKPAQPGLVAEPELVIRRSQDDGIFPNSELPLVLYRQAVAPPVRDPASVFEKIFELNDWRNCWRNGIYPFHHYHSISHEVLGIYAGSAQLQLGGESGVVYQVRPGDVLVIPAGVAHRNRDSTQDFGVVGAYPEGRRWDMNYGRPGERPIADHNIARVPLPATDPLYGSTGPLLSHWTLSPPTLSKR